MQTSLESTGNLERRVTLRLPQDQLDTQVGGRLREIARTARIKGFRPGKVPAKVIEQRYGQQVRAEILDGMLRQGFDESFQQAAVRAGVDVEAGPRLAHPESRPMGALPAGILADAEYRRGLAVAVLEDVVQQKGGPLFGAKPLQEQQERQQLQQAAFKGETEKIPLSLEAPNKKALAKARIARAQYCARHSFSCQWPRLSKSINGLKKILFGSSISKEKRS